MRKLAILCRRLRRVGIVALVTKHTGEPYVIRWAPVGIDYASYNSTTSKTVCECEQFLLGLFNQ